MTQPEPNVTSMPFSVFEKAVTYAANVQERLKRASTALEKAGIPYAVIGGNAVMAWVAQIDESAIRYTNDVDLLLDYENFGRAKIALEGVGFVFRHAVGIDMFLDGPKGKAREAVHIIKAGQKVRPEYHVPAPTVNEVVSVPGKGRILSLEALVRMKLTSYRHKDITHLQDMVSVGLITPDWPERYPSPLSERLVEVLENPEA